MPLLGVQGCLAMTGLGLEDQAVLVTGAAGGIGRATTQALAGAGARVVCVDNNEEALLATLENFRGTGVPLVGDLRRVDRIDDLLDAAEAAVGPLSAVAGLAAVLRRAQAADVTEDDWDQQLDINAKASFFLGRAFGERQKRRGLPGSVVFAASQSWWTGGLDGSIVYAASKGALVSMTRGFARHYGPAGIRYNTVAPGFVDAGMLRGGLDDAAMDRMLASVPLGRLASAEDIAGAISFLISPMSSYITGATLVVAGGQLMY